jgi:hypothetical protein
MKTYELLDTPEKWTKGAFARDSKGDSIDPRSSEAVCWCIEGALYKCYTDYDDWRVARRLIKEIKKANKLGYLVSWQDDPERTYDEVIEILKLADV